MKYKNAQKILPKEIIKIIQQYVDGNYLYIPRKDENRKSWGENSGFKNELIEIVLGKLIGNIKCIINKA